MAKRSPQIIKAEIKVLQDELNAIEDKIELRKMKHFVSIAKGKWFKSNKWYKTNQFIKVLDITSSPTMDTANMHIIELTFIDDSSLKIRETDITVFGGFGTDVYEEVAESDILSKYNNVIGNQHDLLYRQV